MDERIITLQIFSFGPNKLSFFFFCFKLGLQVIYIYKQYLAIMIFVCSATRIVPYALRRTVKTAGSYEVTEKKRESEGERERERVRERVPGRKSEKH